MRISDLTKETKKLEVVYKTTRTFPCWWNTGRRQTLGF